MAFSKKNNFLTIGIPIFNGGEFIEKRISNIKRVTKVDYHIIISDNCSDDNTEIICKQILRRNKNISYFRQKKNIGVVDNFKFLLKKSLSKYFIFASVDDVWNKNFIKDCFNLINRDDVAIAFSNFYISDKNTNKNIPIYVTPSVSNSDFIRLTTRILDPVPHIIYGIFNLEYFELNTLKNIDFFDIHLTMLISIKGKIMISNDFNFQWQVDSYRKSYSIINKKLSYNKFFFKTCKEMNKFNFFKRIFLTLLLFRWVLQNYLIRLFNPKIFDVKF